MKLYYSPGACSQAPHIALHELGLPFEAVKVDLVKHTLAGRLRLSARSIQRATCPSLVLDDGTSISEANVILQYIADQKPGQLAPVFGTKERWKLMEWLAFIATEVHKGFGPLWNPKTPADVRERRSQALGNRFTLISKTLSEAAVPHGRQVHDRRRVPVRCVLNWAGHAQGRPQPRGRRCSSSRRASRRARRCRRLLKAEGLDQVTRERCEVQRMTDCPRCSFPTARRCTRSMRAAPGRRGVRWRNRSSLHEATRRADRLGTLGNRVADADGRQRAADDPRLRRFPGRAVSPALRRARVARPCTAGGRTAARRGHESVDQCLSRHRPRRVGTAALDVSGASTCPSCSSRCNRHSARRITLRSVAHWRR